MPAFLVTHLVANETAVIRTFYNAKFHSLASVTYHAFQEKGHNY